MRLQWVTSHCWHFPTGLIIYWDCKPHYPPKSFLHGGRCPQPPPPLCPAQLILLFPSHSCWRSERDCPGPRETGTRNSHSVIIQLYFGKLQRQKAGAGRVLSFCLTAQMEYCIAAYS